MVSTFGALLGLGFAIGLRHALEADHLAAVASLASRSASPREIVGQGVFWGLGHGLALALAAGLVLSLGIQFPPVLASLLEGAVAIMLLYLGWQAIADARRLKVHMHVHRHDDGVVHWHAHKHAALENHAHEDHRHGHSSRRAIGVGLIHGLAGSAALVLLTLESASSIAAAWLYVLAFGLGALAGMALLSVIVALPIRGHVVAPKLRQAVQRVVGVGTIMVGSWLLWSVVTPVWSVA